MMNSKQAPRKSWMWHCGNEPGRHLVFLLLLRVHQVLSVSCTRCTVLAQAERA